MAEKDTLFSHLVDIKNSLIFVMANVDKRHEATTNMMNEKMLALEDKVVRVQDVIKDTVQFSNRTYFMEEARNLKLERLKAEKENLVINEKLKLAKRRIGELENIITEYRQRESGHIVAGQFGHHGVSEEDINDV